MTPARTRLAATLARIAGEIGGLDRELLEHHVRTRTPEWERRLGEVLEAARAVLGPELLRGLPIEPAGARHPGLDGEPGEAFRFDDGQEAA